MRWYVGLALSVLVMAPREAEPCSCVEMAPCQRFWEADAVFTGVVTGVTLSRQRKEMLSHTTFVVDRGFRSASGQLVVIGNPNGTCHFQFIVGQRYFVYAHRRPDGALTTSVCSGNRRLADAEPDLDFAERLPPPGSGGRIFGRVRRIEEDLLDRRKSRDRYPADVSIVLGHSDGSRVELRTDSRGEFDASGFKPGTYSIAMDVPATARVYLPQSIELKDRGCVPLNPAYASNGRIAGRILDPDGHPASQVLVSVFPSSFTTKKEYPHVNMQSKSTDADGRYELGPLPPGDYHVGVHVEWPPRLDAPYPTAYYPGVAARAEAATISVREGQMRRADWVIPRKLSALTISGIVIYSDGTPASGVNVILVAGTVSGVSSARTDESGTFNLTGLTGSDYSIRASSYVSPENNWSGSIAISLLTEPVSGVKIVLKRH